MTLRLKTLRLSWFRGAADDLTLETSNRSVVVYGPNGSGKSSLVDGVEYLLTGGRIEHLVSEYSGKRQENAVPNTHKPEEAPSSVQVIFENGKKSSISMVKSSKINYDGEENLIHWNASRSILRQESVAEFVKSAKSEKYNLVLPLLGLQPLDDAAANLRTVRQDVERIGKLSAMVGEFAAIQRRRDLAFPNTDDEGIAKNIEELLAYYLPSIPMMATLQEQIDALRPAIQGRIDGLDAESKINVLFCQARDAGLKEALLSYTALVLQAAEAAEPFLAERLKVLRAAQTFSASVGRSDGRDKIDCPACGQGIAIGDFKAHVKSEAERLEEALTLYEKRSLATRTVMAALVTVQNILQDHAIKKYLGIDDKDDRMAKIESLLKFSPTQLTISNSAANISDFDVILNKVMSFVETEASYAPVSTQKLVRDRDAAIAAADWDSSRILQNEIAKIRALINYLENAEVKIREEIRAQAEAVIADISSDVASMWEILHPGELIDEISLYQIEGIDKAIDLRLRFHGKEQLSPRLTLSEGHRNSLGLCIFLALAKRGGEIVPIILDDVVTSFDREHRLSVVDLILAHFTEMQLIVFTHDYDWFIELNHRLPAKHWSFLQLRPFSDPAVGIQWSASPIGFEPARALLAADPSAAANKARGLLDQHLAILSDKLAIEMPFIRGPRNDQRLAHEMLLRLASSGSKAFKVAKEGKAHERSPLFSDAASRLSRLMVPFANPASHGRIVTTREAEQIINEGEGLLATLTCNGCQRKIYHADVPGKHLQCECGSLRWSI